MTLSEFKEELIDGFLGAIPDLDDERTAQQDRLAMDALRHRIFDAIDREYDKFIDPTKENRIEDCAVYFKNHGE